MKTLNKNIHRMVKQYGDKIEEQNLKLHDIAYNYDISAEEEGRSFTMFCDMERDFYNEILEDKGLKNNYIGRTSTFFIDDNYNTLSNYFLDQFNNVRITWDTIVDYLLEYTNYDDLLEVRQEQAQGELLGVLLTVLEPLFKDILEIQQYIKEFKDNQLDNYKFFKDDYEYLNNMILKDMIL